MSPGDAVDTFVHRATVQLGDARAEMIEEHFRIVLKPLPWWCPRWLWRWLVPQLLVLEEQR